MEAFLGTVLAWAPTFAPRGWSYCNDHLLAISSNSALFSLLGTTYGGNGQTTFALAGSHTVNFNGTNLSSGVYMYRLQAGNNVFTKKLTLIK